MAVSRFQNPRVLFIAALSLSVAGIVFWGQSISAQIGVVDWWTFIHCQGSGTDHSEASYVGSSERFNDDGFSFLQCHGTPGQQGSCWDSDQSVTWNVWCLHQPGEGVQQCGAVGFCRDGTQISCSGTGGGAFSGIKSDSIKGTSHLFVNCDGPGGQSVQKFRCEI